MRAESESSPIADASQLLKSEKLGAQLNLKNLCFASAIVVAHGGKIFHLMALWHESVFSNALPCNISVPHTLREQKQPSRPEGTMNIQ